MSDTRIKMGQPSVSAGSARSLLGFVPILHWRNAGLRDAGRPVSTRHGDDAPRLVGAFRPPAPGGSGGSNPLAPTIPFNVLPLQCVQSYPF